MQGRVRPAELPQGLLLDLVLDAAAAEGPDLTAAGIDDHHGPRLLGRRSPGLHDLAEHQLAILLQGLDELFQDVAHSLGFPMPGLGTPKLSTMK